jgi:KaiC domain protein
MYWKEVIREAIHIPKEIKKKVPKLYGIKSGVEGLDDLFYIIDESGNIRKLGGLPSNAVINVTGVPDTGKSLLAEQFTVMQASLGNPTIFVTVETTAPFLVQSLELRSRAMNLNWEELQDNIIIIDAATYTNLRENPENLINTMAYAIKEYNVKNVVIDSITGLYESKEMMARNIVRRIYTFLKKWYQTGILVSQKRSAHEEISAEAAGGYAVAHIVDGTIVLGKKVIEKPFEVRMFNLDYGDIIRLLRIDGMRMCGHDTRTYVVEITKSGILKVVKPLSEYFKRK